MKVACLVPVRNKAFFVDQTVKSVLVQSYEGMEVILSDQGSTDNSLDILKKMAKSYNGPNTVRVVECPHTDAKGLAGFNIHLHWLMSQTDADLLVIVSADDLCHPDRVKRTVEVYEQYRPAFIGTRMQFLTPDGKLEGQTAWALQNLKEGESRFVTAKEHIEGLIGGSSSTTFDREFYEKIGGLQGHTILDVYLPFLATFDRGFYFINEDLFAYIRHSDPNNAGLGGQMLAAKDTNEQLLINELSGYQVVSTLYQAGKVATTVYADKWNNGQCEAAETLYFNIVNRTLDWTNCRNLLNERKLQPRCLYG